MDMFSLWTRNFKPLLLFATDLAAKPKDSLWSVHLVYNDKYKPLHKKPTNSFQAETDVSQGLRPRWSESSM